MIGGEYKLFVSYQLLKEQVEGWLKGFKIDKKGIPKSQWENEIKKSHIAIEKIHPMQDGNGRLFRLLMNIQRYNTGLPIHIIKEGDEQYEYYLWFKEN